ncbi:MAG TPA: ribonuclease HI family protein [Candidatus Eremiobacteraceae bacterium]|nr:ribonuclease HI family protein [Candidatus Eremiobacteraceae bacterium]
MKKDGICTIYTDGGARGNPGPAAGGGVIVASDGTVIAEVSEFLGVATNNVAEYQALIATLQRALEAGCTDVEVCLDSELVVRQLNGEYRVKDAKMRPLHASATSLLRKFASSRVRHIPREENKRADKLVNAVLDAHATAVREARVGL